MLKLKNMLTSINSLINDLTQYQTMIVAHDTIQAHNDQLNYELQYANFDHNHLSHEYN
jgi:hypothetical protein